MLLPNRVRVLAACEPVDFRKGFDGLCGVVRNTLGEEAQGATLFVFHNRRRDQIRILWWDRNGFAIWMKRLERGTFCFPKLTGTKVGISAAELAAILEGAVVLRRSA